MATFRKVIFTSVLGLSLFAAGGCSSLFGDDDDDDDRRVSRDYDYDRYDRSSRDYDRDARVSRSGGERVERDERTARKVPRDARVVDEGRSDTLTHTARYDGEVYLLDSTATTVVWDAKIRNGDRITVDPRRNRIEINGREQANINLAGDHKFQLFYLETGRGSYRY